MNLYKRIIIGILRFFEHKKTHAFLVHFDNQIYHVCARCSGLYLGLLLGFPLTVMMLVFMPFIFGLGDVILTVIALCFGLPTLIDWVTQRLAWRNSTNRIRFGTAFFGGLFLTWYLLSPASIVIKIPLLFIILVFVSLFSYIDRRAPSNESIEIQEHDES